MTVVTGVPERRDIWVLDSATSISSRLTFDAALASWPVWSPDGERIVFEKRTGKPGLYLKSARGDGQEELALPDEGGTVYPAAWSADGSFIAYTQQSRTSSFDLWVLPMKGDRKPFAFLQTPSKEENPVFTPDGRWLAYESDETGQRQVYVQPFPASGGKYLISREGGSQPMWRGDGRELFFLAPDGMLMAAAIGTAPQFQAANPQSLFVSGTSRAMNRHAYAAAKDGQRFLVNVAQPQSNQTSLTVVLHWPAAVQK